LNSRITGETIFTSFLLCIFVAGSVVSLGWPSQARGLPLALMGGGAVLTFVVLLSGMKSVSEEVGASEEAAYEQPDTEVVPEGEWRMIVWILAFLGMVLVVGFWVTTAVFMPAFMLTFGRESWKMAGAFVTVSLVALYLIFHVALQIPLYGGILGFAFL